MYRVSIYTDGACSGNPGIGGYGAILSCNGKERIVRGYEKMSTNNRMELKAVVESIKILKAPCEIELFTDSQYILNCTAHDRKWLTAENRPNKDLWVELIEAGLKGQHKIRFVKVQGHSGIVLNERCDKIAKEQVVKCRHEAY